MDKRDKGLDYPNMMSIPNYALYGEDKGTPDESWLHWETITSRSRLYGFRIAPHRHEQLFQILFLASGGAEVRLDDEVHALVGPSVVTVPAMTVHSFVFTPDVDGFVLTIFDRDAEAVAAESREIHESLGRPKALGELATMDPDGEIGHQVRRLIAEVDRTGEGQMAALRARLMLLLVAIHRADLEGRDHRGAAGGRTDQLGRSFQALVDTHYRDTRSVGFFADKLAITPTHLNRICRVVFGDTALGVIERRVLLEAKRYLQFSGLSIKEIGILLGYPDPAYFSRFFTKRAGMAPAAFRSLMETRASQLK